MALVMAMVTMWTDGNIIPSSLRSGRLSMRYGRGVLPLVSTVSLIGDVIGVEGAAHGAVSDFSGPPLEVMVTTGLRSKSSDASDMGDIW